MRRRLSTCKFCTEVIRWVMSDTGWQIPIDPYPVVGGNLIRSIDNGGQIHVRRVRRGEYPPDTALYMAHSDTCAKGPGARRRAKRNGRAARPPVSAPPLTAEDLLPLPLPLLPPETGR